MSNDILDDSLKDRKMILLQRMKVNPLITIACMANELGVSESTISREIKSLKRKDLLIEKEVEIMALGVM